MMAKETVDKINNVIALVAGGIFFFIMLLATRFINPFLSALASLVVGVLVYVATKWRLRRFQRMGERWQRAAEEGIAERAANYDLEGEISKLSDFDKEIYFWLVEKIRKNANIQIDWEKMAENEIRGRGYYKEDWQGHYALERIMKIITDIRSYQPQYLEKQ